MAKALGALGDDGLLSIPCGESSEPSAVLEVAAAVCAERPRATSILSIATRFWVTDDRPHRCPAYLLGASSACLA